MCYTVYIPKTGRRIYMEENKNLNNEIDEAVAEIDPSEMSQ